MELKKKKKKKKKRVVGREKKKTRRDDSWTNLESAWFLKYLKGSFWCLFFSSISTADSRVGYNQNVM